MDLRDLRWLAAVMTIIIFSFCASPAQRRVEVSYPNCEVSEKDSSRHTVIFEVKCPDKAPFTKTFHRK